MEATSQGRDFLQTVAERYACGFYLYNLIIVSVGFVGARVLVGELPAEKLGQTGVLDFVDLAEVEPSSAGGDHQGVFCVLVPLWLLVSTFGV